MGYRPCSNEGSQSELFDDASLPLCADQQPVVTVKYRESPSSFTPAPKPFITSPFFAAVPQKPGTKRVVKVGDYDYEIGGPVVTSKKARYAALDVRHGELILASMSFWKRETDGGQIEFCLADLFRKLRTSKGGAQTDRVLELFQDMAVTAIRRHNRVLESEADRRFPIVKEVSIRGETITGIVLDQRFCELFAVGAPCIDIRLDVLTGMSRALAKALYLYMPSRAFYHSERNPFKRTLTNLLLETGCDAPAHKSARLQRFERRFTNNASVLDQLSGVETSSGKLRLKLEPTEDDSDYNLLVWMDRTEEAPKPETKSKLLAAWLTSGRSEADFHQRGTCELSEYDREQLSTCGVAVPPIEQFLRRAKALVHPNTFESRIGDIKTSVLSLDGPINNPPGALIGALIAAVKDRC